MFEDLLQLYSERAGNSPVQGTPGRSVPSLCAHPQARDDPEQNNTNALLSIMALANADFFLPGWLFQ